MSSGNLDHWLCPSFNRGAFELFQCLTLPFLHAFTNWPLIQDYNFFLERSERQITSKLGQTIRFVEQTHKPSSFEEQYEPRIFLKGEVLTRYASWHDFFNMLIWLTFPTTKAMLNNLQYLSIKQRIHKSPQRNALENMLTLFDENGLVIVSSDATLLSLIENFQWKELFWHRRSAIEKKLRCYVFGHSLHEKFLKPYIGMTGHAILLQENQTFFNNTLSDQIQTIDSTLAQIFAQKKINSPSMLKPFPVLGMPNWYDNGQESFYDNKSYFRQSRR